jgi:hypothetical protein
MYVEHDLGGGSSLSSLMVAKLSERKGVAVRRGLKEAGAKPRPDGQERQEPGHHNNARTAENASARLN